MLKKTILQDSFNSFKRRFLIIVLTLRYFKNSEKLNISETNNLNQKEKVEEVETSYSSNIIENVKYSSEDPKGNEYTIIAKKGEIDIRNSNIIFLKNVKAIIKLRNSNEILIFSDFGKYNISNFDTIFNENVIINYLQNTIKGEYLDFSILKNSMIISQNVIYTDTINTLKTDVIEMNIDTKDTKFFMYNKNNKVEVKSIN